MLEPRFNLFAQRPAQARSLECQAAELGLDPMRLSPPEAKLGYALLELITDPEWFGCPNFCNLFLPHGELASMDDMPPISGRKLGVINIAPGCWIDAYQADYLIHAKAPGSVHVAKASLECDGYSFHDRSQEEFARERKRDRDFQEIGLTVLRRPAYEVIDSPLKVARETIEYLLRLSTSRGGRE